MGPSRSFSLFKEAKSLIKLAMQSSVTEIIPACLSRSVEVQARIDEISVQAMSTLTSLLVDRRLHEPEMVVNLLIRPAGFYPWVISKRLEAHGWLSWAKARSCLRSSRAAPLELPETTYHGLSSTKALPASCRQNLHKQPQDPKHRTPVGRSSGPVARDSAA